MNDKLETELQQQLRASEAELDAATRTKLREARQRATAEAEHAGTPWLQSWLPVTATASVVMLAIVVVVTIRTPGEGEPDVNMANIDEPEVENPLTEPSITEFEAAMVLAAETDELLQPQSDEPGDESGDAGELLDLYEHLEFYEWLALEDPEEASS